MQTLPNIAAVEVEWARDLVSIEQFEVGKLLNSVWQEPHWSRIYEYPWIWCHAGFGSGQWVLDAAGGDSPLQHFMAKAGAQVVNVDLDEAAIKRAPGARVLRSLCDLHDLSKVFQDAVFDVVVCASVLEHKEAERPLDILNECWRVLRPGGRLLVTFDVASYVRWNHHVDRAEAEKIVAFLGASLPALPDDVFKITLPEIDPAPDEPKTVGLNVLCACVQKAVP